MSRPYTMLHFVDGLAAEVKMPDDWGGGFYPRDADQAVVIARLLMYGVDYQASFDQGDVSSGQTYGLGYHYTTNSTVWSLGKFKTGFDGMKNRQPEHL